MEDPAFELLNVLVGWSLPVFVGMLLYMKIKRPKYRFFETRSTLHAFFLSLGMMVPSACAAVEVACGPIKLGDSRLFSLGGLVFFLALWVQLGVSLFGRNALNADG